MGNALVRRAIALRPIYPHVTSSAYLVLVRMCLTAYDRDEAEDRHARQYYGGWRPLAMVLGYKDPGDEEQLPADAHKAVMRAVRELTETGLIGRAGTQWSGGIRRRVYDIRV